MSSQNPTQISTEVMVMFFDTDSGGVVHNIAYLRFIETARTMLALQMGMKFEDWHSTGIFPVVVRTEIDYRKPALPGEKIVVNGRLSEVSGVRMWFNFEIVRPADGTVLVTCKQALAMVNKADGKPQRLSKELAELLNISA
ncbi:MAG: thioesterase family protein [Chthoniobacterales bacterium]